MLEVQGIETFYGNIKALKSVSLKAGKGEIIAVFGANGAGKTTLLRTISGILSPSTGSIFFEGKRIDRLYPRKITILGVVQVPQERALFPDMTVKENLELGAYTRKDIHGIREDFNRVFSLFPILRERQSQDARTLSGGEQQMLAIGRALMCRPRLLMLDEPTAGLSPILVLAVSNVLKQINEQGITILLIEQNARMAISICSYGYVMELGRVVIEGTRAELAQREEVKKAYLGEL
jgi:branched-chain amino acid transport system ATP-binding protein